MCVQGVANVSAFCVAALQLASFACRFGRDRRVLELVPGLDFDVSPLQSAIQTLQLGLQLQ